MTDLAGRTAFVTGGANGIGLGLARALLDGGLQGGDRRHPSGLDRAGRQGARHRRRARRPARRLVAGWLRPRRRQAEAALGPVSLLFNNAGINLFRTIDESSYDDWDWVLGVNLHGVINGVVTFVPRMKQRGQGGHIVNTASMAGFLAGPVPGIYNCSKFAVRGLSESLCYSLAPHGIGVSVLCPGLVKSYIYASDEVRPEALKAARPGDRSCLRRATRHDPPGGDGARRGRRQGARRGPRQPLLRLHATPSTRTSCGRCSTRSSPTTPTATLPPTAWRSRRIGASATARPARPRVISASRHRNRTSASRPRSSRPRVSWSFGATMRCWVVTCTSRRQRCSTLDS